MVGLAKWRGLCRWQGSARWRPIHARQGPGVTSGPDRPIRLQDLGQVPDVLRPSSSLLLSDLVSLFVVVVYKMKISCCTLEAGILSTPRKDPQKAPLLFYLVNAFLEARGVTCIIVSSPTTGIKRSLRITF